MAKKDRDLRPLEIGVEVTLILTEVSGTRSRSGARRRALGVGYGTVTARLPEQDAREDVVYRVRLVRSSEAHMIGKDVEIPRGWLYKVGARDEARAFEEAVRMFWRKDRG